MKPTKKWYAALVAGAGSILASWIVTGAFDDVERGMSGTLVIALSSSFIRTNDDTPGGVPA